MGKDLRILLGRNVQELRKRAGLTQAELSERVNVSPEFLSRVERCLKSPSLDTVGRIAKALGVQVQELFKEDPTPWGERDDEISELIATLGGLDAPALRQVIEVARAVVKHR
jgi:transcriptional regulator with XRE-family HTH domain